ncbi:MAG: phage holin family protein [Terrimesophilobacter sp.]
MTEQNRTRAEKRSLISLVMSLPSLLVELVKSELEQLKAELIRKLKHAGIGIGFLAVAAVFAVFAAGVFTAAAILGLAVVFPAWLAALMVGALLVIIVVVFVLLGLNQLKKSDPKPTETITSVRRDLRVIKGTANRRAS